MEEVELLQATVDAVGEADNEIGGFRQTRLREFTQVGILSPPTFIWYASGLITTRDPTELSIGDWIRLDSDGRFFEIVGFGVIMGGGFDVDIDLQGQPSPETPWNVPAATTTWNGTTTVYTNQPDSYFVGYWLFPIFLSPLDIIWFEIVAKSGNYLTIANPFGFTIPSGTAVNNTYHSPGPGVSRRAEALAVESVLNWPDSGFVALDGIKYKYTSKTLSPMELLGISYVDASQEIIGLARDHSEGAVVTDVTRDSSALELTRSAMLVDYADGEDLNAIGRNYGVLRYPFLESDDVFREIIKALAYNPRGTMFGLELALDAMIGPGNYELYEDLVNHPCTVFVRLLGDAALTDRSTGKAILTGPEPVDPTTTTSVDISGTVINRGTVYSVRLKDHVHDGDFRSVKPSALQIEDVPGSPVQAWTYDGTGGSTEGANVTQLAGGLGIQFTHVAGSVSKYTAARRFIDRTTDWSVDCVIKIPSSALLSNFTTRYRQLGVFINDGENTMGFGFRRANDFVTGIRLVDSGINHRGPEGGVVRNAYVPIQIRKTGGYNGLVELLVNGIVISAVPRSEFVGSTSARTIEFGIDNTLSPVTVQGIFAQLSFRVLPKEKDYWNLYHENATLGAPNDIQIATSEFQSGDVGKRIETYGSGVTNPEGGNNNGKFEVSSYTDANNIEVQGVEQVDSASTVGQPNPRRIIVDSRQQQFIYPDDLGKEIVLLDSVQGNNGTYVIEKLLDPDTLINLAAWSTPLRTETNVCEIEEPAPLFEFVPETAISFRVNPVFVAEGSMSFVMSDAGSESGGTLTLREPLPSADDIVDVWYNEVLSALVLLDFSIKNVIVQTLPEILWQYYPFYLSDPLGFVRAYLDDITAAGVIPEYDVE